MNNLCIGTGVNTYSLHPGIVKTELGRTIDQVYFPGLRFLANIVFYPIMKTPEQGAQTTLYCSIDEKAGKETGLYYRFNFKIIKYHFILLQTTILCCFLVIAR